MKIYITGDVHQDYISLHQRLDGVEDHSLFLIMGDAGFLWSGSEYERFSNRFLDDYCIRHDITIIAMQGNHENFHMMYALPTKQVFGATMYCVGQQIYFAQRGEIMTINKKKFFCWGGGRSIDKDRRKPLISWWPQEDCTEVDFSNAIDCINRHGNYVDVVLSHVAPDDVLHMIDKYHVLDEIDISAMYLKELCSEILENKFKQAFFGHYHLNHVLHNKYYFLYEQVLELEV